MLRLFGIYYFIFIKSYIINILMEAEIKNDQELYSYFRGRTATLCRDNFTFLMDHPEVKRVLNDYLSNILLHKPDDVFKFTKDYFKFLSDKGESVKFVVLVGPNSVGKSTLIDRVMNEYPNVFERPKFTSSKEKENCIVVSKEDFMDIVLKIFSERGVNESDRG